MVVHDIHRIIVPQWPMRLWRVGDVVAAPPTDQPSSSYTRASSVRVVEELPAWSLFGPRGWKVAGVIERARNLTAIDVAALSRLRSADGSSIYEAAWGRWRAQASTAGSPVGHGLIIVDQVIDQAAKAIGPALFTFDPHDEVTVLSDPTWVRASRACQEAALAFGAPDLLHSDELDTLTAPWRHHFGLPPADPRTP